MQLSDVAPAFVTMAHEIVWASVATVDPEGRPRTRVLHPIWEWNGDELVGWIGTGPTPVKTAHLARTPYASVNYWDAEQDVATAECATTWHHDDDTCIRVWNLLKHAPAPVGYDPAMIPSWDEPTSDSFAALRLDPYRLRVFPGSLLLTGQGDLRTWRA